jgi:hypothetical protein
MGTQQITGDNHKGLALILEIQDTERVVTSSRRRTEFEETYFNLKSDMERLLAIGETGSRSVAPKVEDRLAWRIQLEVTLLRRAEGLL